MVCFCDIPLSQTKRHSKNYGSYAIGLTKKWGMTNKINPVIYAYPNSTTADILNQILSELNNFFDIDEKFLPKEKNNPKRNNLKDFLSDLNKYLNHPTVKYKVEVTDKIQDLIKQLSHFLRYIKPYEGKVYRDTDYLDNVVKFYDEREWRFVPDKKTILSAKLKDSFEPEYYKNLTKRRAINIKLAKHSKLTFKPNDIRFIIVEKDKEIPEMLDELEKIFGNSATHKDLKLLGTRLISMEQIIENI